jgi:hypothetical protein
MTGFVICGLEHSGTTVVAELLRQVHGVDAGFEIGVLLGASPRVFPTLQPYAAHVRRDWGVSEATLEHCCDTDDFAAFYSRLQRAATTLRPGTHTIFDKTPRYLATLDHCLARTTAPFIVVFKDPRSTVHSDYKNMWMPDFDSWLDEYAPAKLGYMRQHYAQYKRAREKADPRVLFVRLEELCLDPRGVCTRMFAHVGLHFHLAHLAFGANRYEKTHARSITAGGPFEYLSGMGIVRCRRIARVFAEFDEWFFE